MTNATERRLLEAAHAAALTHRRHRRLKGAREKGSRPYIEHPVEVALLAARTVDTLSTDALCAALLHDTIEDGDLTGAAIEARCGARVAAMVEALTDEEGLSPAEKHEQGLARIARMESETRWIKVCDKLANARDIVETQPRGWNLRKIDFYVERCAQTVARAGALPEALERHAGQVLGKRLAQARERAPATVREHLERQIGFSLRTFGPGPRDRQIRAHAEREHAEALVETHGGRARRKYGDVAMLGMDGAWRSLWAGHGGEIARAAEQTRAQLGAQREETLCAWAGRCAGTSTSRDEADERVGRTLRATETARVGEERARAYAALARAAVGAALHTEGASPRNTAAAVMEKLARNECRRWPDWRTHPTDEPLEHIRETHA